MGLFYLLVIALVVLAARRLIRARRTPIVITRASEVSVRGWRTSAAMAWRDVREIALARSPVMGIDDFCITLKGDGADSLTVSSTYDGFDAFEVRVLELWPVIRTEWRRVQALSPDFSERVIAWRRS